MPHFLLVMLSQLLPVNYTDHALVTFTPQSTLEAERVRSLGRFAGCCEPRGLGPQHRVLTQAELNLAIQEARALQGVAGTSFFDDYRTNEEIDVYLDQLVATNPGVSCNGLNEDLDGDGTVGFVDLVLLLSSFGPCDSCQADFNGNGSVDFEDLVRLLSAWS